MLKHCKVIKLIFIGIYSLLWLILTPSASLAKTTSQQLLIATTTSVDNTGLLEYLAPLFKQDSSIELKWVAVGTGKALALGKNCDVDAVLVHSLLAEQKFIASGYGVERTQIMYNDFVMVGPPSDPVNIRQLTITEAFKTIAQNQALFISRADDSGTDHKEKEIWKKVQIDPTKKSSWYLQSGQGMMNTLQIAAEKKAYTLTDRATFTKYQSLHPQNTPLMILVQDNPSNRVGQELKNQYAIIIVNPQYCPKISYDSAKKFKNWMITTRTQNAIDDYKILGKQLFFSNAELPTPTQVH